MTGPHPPQAPLCFKNSPNRIGRDDQSSENDNQTHSRTINTIALNQCSAVGHHLVAAVLVLSSLGHRHFSQMRAGLTAQPDRS